MLPTTMTSKFNNTGLVGYPSQAMVLFVSVRRSQSLIGSKHTMIVYLPVFSIEEKPVEKRSREHVEINPTLLAYSMAVPLQNEVRADADSVARKQMMRLFGAVSKIFEELLQDGDLVVLS